MMLKKISDIVDMSFDIPDSEKEMGQKARLHFEGAANALKFAVDHLDIIYEPFKNNTTISPQSVIDNRGVLQGRYSTKIKNNFTDVKKHSLLAIKYFNFFAKGDAAIRELINTYVESVNDVENRVSIFLDILRNDYRLEDFRDKVLKAVDDVRKAAKDLDNLVYDRIIEHIDENIISKKWMDFNSDNVSITEDVPLIRELYEERQKALNTGAFPATDKAEQSLNISDATQMLNPDFVRFKQIGEQ